MTSEAHSLPPVQITIDVGLAQIEPANLDTLKPLLEYKKFTFCSSGGRLRRECRTQAAYQLTPDSRLLAPAGCVPRLRRAVEQLGLSVAVKDLRNLNSELYQIDIKHRAKAEKAFPGLAAAIERNVQGAIAAPRGTKRDALIGHITRLFAKPRIFIACATIDDTKRVCAALGPFVGGEVDTVRGGNWRSPCRVVCGTYKALDHSQPSDWPVLIFEDGVEAMGHATHDALGGYGCNRRYALVDPHHSHSPANILKLEMLAGPLIYTAASRKKRPPVAVRLADYPAPAVQRSEDHRQRKEQLWQDSSRNRAVADVASAIADEDQPALWRYGLFLDEEPVTTDPRKPAVIIVVESVDHAQHLANLLPNWRVFHGDPSTDTGETLHNLWGVPPCSIVTMVYGNECQRLAADVVIVAAGGAHPQIPLPLDKRRGPLTIIDFADAFDAVAENETQKRLTVYRELGFEVLGQVPRRAPLECDQQQALLSMQRRKPNTSRRSRRQQPR